MYALGRISAVLNASITSVTLEQSVLTIQASGHIWALNSLVVKNEAMTRRGSWPRDGIPIKGSASELPESVQGAATASPPLRLITT